MPDEPDHGTDEAKKTSERKRLGLQTMREMLEPGAADKIATRNAIAPSWQRWTTEILYGDLWQGEALDRRHRSIVTLSALLATMRMPEVKIHMRAALKNGVTSEEIVEIIQQVAFYAGWPVGAESLPILIEITNEAEAQTTP